MIVLLAPPVLSAPLFLVPVSSAPVFSAPVFSVPVSSAPLFLVPVSSAPFFPWPVPIAAAAAALAVWVVIPSLDRAGRVGDPLAGDGRRAVRAGPGAWVRRRFRSRAAPQVQALLTALVAELATGQPTTHALAQACVGLDPPPCPHALRAAQFGADVAEGLRQDARASGAQALGALAACWDVASQSGAGLAQAVSRLAEGVRSTEQARAQLAAEVAAVRASAKILAALPAFGLLVGHWIGAEPLVWLTASWAGRGVLVVGLALEGVGLIWLRRMVAGVEALL